jgi:hypothetical protein
MIAIVTVLFLPGPALIAFGILWLGGTVVLAGVLLVAGALAVAAGGLRHQPLRDHRDERHQRAGDRVASGPEQQRRTQSSPSPGEVAPRQGAGVDAGRPLHGSTCAGCNNA